LYFANFGSAALLKLQVEKLAGKPFRSDQSVIELRNKSYEAEFSASRLWGGAA